MNTLLFYSGAFRGYYARPRHAKISRLLAPMWDVRLIITAKGKIK